MSIKFPTDPEQRWECVKYQLRLRGSSLASIAQELGVGRNAVINAKRIRYPRVERAIARKLSVSPRDIWPERWQSDGAPRRERPNVGERKAGYCHKDTKSNAISHCQMARSA